VSEVDKLIGDGAMAYWFVDSVDREKFPERSPGNLRQWINAEYNRSRPFSPNLHRVEIPESV
jgi:hypothetical protein